jgi:hypothetical protein
MRPIAIFYHGVFFLGEDSPKLLPLSTQIIPTQMKALITSGLATQTNHFMIGVNGGSESVEMVKACMPENAKVVYHGLTSRSENLTLVELEKWLPGHEDWNVLYFHSKGVTHEEGSAHFRYASRWRDCMMKHCIHNWRQCVESLDSGCDSVGCHWLTDQCGGTQNIWAGNFWWAKASFLLTLPSIFERGRIKQSGISSKESRFESEVWIGNGPKLPVIKDFHPGHPKIHVY